MPKGIFTISLDFELYWGVRDHRSIEEYGENIRNVHKVVPRLLELFEKYGIHCTWAMVGFLFFNSKDELVNNLPGVLPDYREKQYDPYRYIEKNELDPVYHFAPELIRMIKKTPGQEIATHTFSHFYALEKNTSIEQFRNDLQAAISVAKEAGIEVSSIIFPRNQYSDLHLQVCQESGIKIYRGNENALAYHPVAREQENLLRRAIRFADAYVNITGHHAHPVPGPGIMINVPASRFLRPYKKTLKFLDGIKLRRIEESMEYAANHGLIYQLWWHPHNFGRYTDENFKFLEKILKVYEKLNLAQKIESYNLIDIYAKLQDAR